MPIVSSIDAEPPPAVGTSVVFRATVSNPSGVWEWVVSDAKGTARGKSATASTFTYLVPATFGEGDKLIVRLRVGESDSFTQSFTVAADPTTLTVIMPDVVGKTYQDALQLVPGVLVVGPFADPPTCAADNVGDLVGFQDPPAGTKVNPTTDPNVTLTRPCREAGTLTIKLEGYDKGSVSTATPPGLNCTSDQCSFQPEVGDTFTLRASRPATWSSCSRTVLTCTISVPPGGAEETVTFPDSSPPNLTTTYSLSGPLIATPEEGDEGEHLDDLGPLTVTAHATDGESTVTSLKLWYVHEYLCPDLDGPPFSMETLTRESDPVTSGGADVSLTTPRGGSNDCPGGFGSSPTVTRFYAEATSTGGTAKTKALILHWVIIG
jgi:hypothetical protein